MNYFKVENSVAYTAFTMWCNHHLSLGVKGTLLVLRSRFLEKSSWDSQGGSIRQEARQEYNEAGESRVGIRYQRMLRQSRNQGWQKLDDTYWRLERRGPSYIATKWPVWISVVQLRLMTSWATSPGENKEWGASHYSGRSALDQDWFLSADFLTETSPTGRRKGEESRVWLFCQFGLKKEIEENKPHILRLLTRQWLYPLAAIKHSLREQHFSEGREWPKLFLGRALSFPQGPTFIYEVGLEAVLNAKQLAVGGSWFKKHVHWVPTMCHTLFLVLRIQWIK